MADDYRTESGNDPWYQYRNIMGVPSRRRVLCVFISIFFILTLIAIAFAVLAKNCCFKDEKLESFTAFESALNTSVDPCVDFYDFSCGFWSKKIPVPNFQLRVTTFSMLQDSINNKKRMIFKDAAENPELPSVVNYAIRFYHMCVHRNESSPDDYKVLIEYFNRINVLPILNEYTFDESHFDWLNASAFLSKNLEIDIVFDMKLVHNEIDGKNSIYIKQPMLFDINLEMLYAVLVNMNSSTEDFDLIIDDMNKWKKSLYESVKITDSLSCTVGELIQQFPDIDWLRYFHIKWLDNLRGFNKTITLSDNVEIQSVDYIKKVANVLSSDVFSKSELANLFGTAVLQKIWILIPGVLEKYAELIGYAAAEESVAGEYCYSLVVDLFPCSLDYLYIRNSSLSEIVDSKTLISYIKLAFHDTFQNSKWLDDESKESVLHILDEMQEIVGFPAYLNNKTEFDLLYNDFPPVEKNILKYYLEIGEYYTQLRDFSLPRSVTDASAYYMVQKNTFVLPISLHNPPFYYRKGPSYLNFGAVGSVIGHEIMHAFGTFEDDDKHDFTNSFTNATTTLFKNHTDCFKDQYDRFDTNLKLQNNGTSTLRENVADSEGLRIAFKAYKKYEAEFSHKYRYQQFRNYTSDQMFFIAYGSVWCSEINPVMYKDSHSFPQLRVNGAVSNSKSFAVAFNCPENAPMNPAKRCLIW